MNRTGRFSSTVLWLAAAVFAGMLARPIHAAEWNWADEQSSITDSPEFAASKAICGSLRDLRPPKAHHPGPAAAEALADCDSEALYYGIGMEADPVRARHCALLEVGQHEQTYGAAFAGRAMLMTMYANGVGAPRDLDLATALACRIEGAPAEVAGRVHHLQQLKTTRWSGRDFHFCDDITSGAAMGICARHDARLADARRSQRIQRLSRWWTDEERAALQPLLDAMWNFADISSRNEVDLSGSGRWAFVAQQEQQLRDAFLAVLETLESHSLPIASAEEYRAADDRLNAVYQNVMAVEIDPDAPRFGYGNPDSLPYTTVTQTGIREAQRAWVAYRDAWLAFAEQRYWQLGDSLGMWLTRQRADALASFVPEPAPSKEPEQ